jgi:hypothetical protein
MMKRLMRRLVPSPAMVVALAALFLALGGSAYALVVTGKTIRNNSVTGKDIRNNSLQGKDMRKDGVGGGAIKESTLAPVPQAGISYGDARFAVVSGAGAAVRSRSVTSAARSAEGRYQVIFSADVRNCAYYATIGDTSASPLQTAASITTASLSSSVNGVAVRTFGSNGNAADRPFHLQVSC